jgi:hypothetical protein
MIETVLFKNIDGVRYKASRKFYKFSFYSHLRPVIVRLNNVLAFYKL